MRNVIVIATTSPSSDGAFGELLATSLVSRGVRGLADGGPGLDRYQLRPKLAGVTYLSYAGHLEQAGHREQARHREEAGE